MVAGVLPGMPAQDVPVSWGVPIRSTVQVAGKPFTVATYPTGIMTLAQHGEVLMLMVREGYRGTSAQGITLGSPAHDVLARYGPPTRRHELPRGHSWAYDAPAHRVSIPRRAGRLLAAVLRAATRVARRQGLAHGRSSRRGRAGACRPNGDLGGGGRLPRRVSGPWGGVRCRGGSYRRVGNGPS